MNKLYEIAANLRSAIENGFEEAEDNAIEESEALKQIDDLNMELGEKLDGITWYIKETDALVKGIDENIKILQARKKAYENKKERLKAYVTDCMNVAGYEKYESAVTKLSFRMSEAVEIADESKIPDMYMTIKTTKSPNKTALKEAILDGEIIDGVVLVKRKNLQIK